MSVVTDDTDTEDLTVMGTITVPTEITMEDLKNISITACEGGIGYWAVMTKGAERGHATYQTHATFEIEPEGDGEPDSTWADWVGISKNRPKPLPTPIVVTPNVLLRGLQLYCDGRYFTDGTIRQRDPRAVLEDLDSDNADVIVQLGCFGEVVFG